MHASLCESGSVVASLYTAARQRPMHSRKQAVFTRLYSRMFRCPVPCDCDLACKCCAHQSSKVAESVQ